MVLFGLEYRPRKPFRYEPRMKQYPLLNCITSCSLGQSDLRTVLPLAELDVLSPK